MGLHRVEGSGIDDGNGGSSEWQWMNSEPYKLNPAHWDDGEPNGEAGGEDCVLLKPAARKMIDLRCDYNTAVATKMICQRRFGE